MPSTETAVSTINGLVAGGPEETTSATALPLATWAPLTGFWLMTAPAGTVVLYAVVTVPTVKPAAVMVVVAAACVMFTTFGTATSGAPDETTSVTALP